MVKALLKKQLAEIFRNYFYDSKKNKARSKAGTVGYFIFFVLIMVGMLGGLFTMMSVSLCAPLCAAGAGWLYFAITGVIAILLGIFGSVFSTYTGLYLAKDNDLLLSLPIPVKYIMLSRLLSVYLMGLMYAAVAILPAVVVYLVTVPFSVKALVGCLVLLILISVFVLTLSCLLGWVVAKISVKLKNKSFVTVLISLAFIGLYYFCYFKAMSIIRDLIANIAVYGPAIREKAYGVYLFGSVGEGDLLAIAVCTAVVALLFGLMWRLLGRTFLSLATATGAGEKKHYVEKRAKQSSADSALLRKEFGRLTSSANCMLNCALGTLLLPILGVVFLVKGPFLVEMLSDVFGPGAMTVLVCTALCMACSMNDTAASSVSLEGKNIWLPRSLPVEPWQVLRAKMRVQLLLTMPLLLFASLCAAAAMRPSVGELIALILLPQVLVLLMALLDLTLDLKRANLGWTNELAPIKQSFQVAVAIFGTWIYCIALAGIYLMLEPPFGAAAYLLLWSVLFTAAGIVLLRWLDRKGAAAFAAL